MTSASKALVAKATTTADFPDLWKSSKKFAADIDRVSTNDIIICGLAITKGTDMTKSAIENRLDRMPEKTTTIIGESVVTRWSFDSYEVGTYGKSTKGFEAAAEEIANDNPNRHQG